MDAETVQRFIEGMKYESSGRGPPEGFPRLPDVPAALHRPCVPQLESDLNVAPKLALCLPRDDFRSPAASCCGGNRHAHLDRARQGQRVRAFYTPAGTGEGRWSNSLRQSRRLVCGYHGWTYSLDGTLVNLRDKRDFRVSTCRLRALTACAANDSPIGCSSTRIPKAEPLLEHTHRSSIFSAVPAGRWRFVAKESFDVKCNVKVLLAPSSKWYHLKSIHTGHGGPLPRPPRHHGSHCIATATPSWSRRIAVPIGRNPGTRGMRASRRPRSSPLTQSVLQLLSNWSHGDPTVFPSCCLAGRPTPACASNALFAPDGRRPPPELWKTRIAISIQPDEEPAIRSADPGVADVAGFLHTLSYQERRIYHCTRNSTAASGRADRIPAPLRVEPLLERFYENWSAAASDRIGAILVLGCNIPKLRVPHSVIAAAMLDMRPGGPPRTGARAICNWDEYP